MLTGLFPPTCGTAFINGSDIRTDMDEIRRSLGICPQYNVLFGRLTVREHLWFCAALKGVRSASLQTEISRYLVDVGLVEKADEWAERLSGGQKRKLSLAMALIGGSRVVILDGELGETPDEGARRMLTLARHGRAERRDGPGQPPPGLGLAAAPPRGPHRDPLHPSHGRGRLGAQLGPFCAGGVRA